MDLAERELRIDSKWENRLNEQLSQLIENGNVPQDCFSALSKGIRDGDFDASEAVYAFLQQVTAFKLKQMGS